MTFKTYELQVVLSSLLPPAVAAPSAGWIASELLDEARLRQSHVELIRRQPSDLGPMGKPMVTATVEDRRPSGARGAPFSKHVEDLLKERAAAMKLELVAFSFDRIPAHPSAREDRGSGLSQAETEVLNTLATAWNRFLLLPVEHPDDNRHFRDAVHAAQAQIMKRPTRRSMRAEAVG